MPGESTVADKEVISVVGREIAEQIWARGALLTARFGAPSHGRQVPLRADIASFVSSHLADPVIPARIVPFLPYTQHELGFIDTADGAGTDRSRYCLRWAASLDPALVIDRRLHGGRESVVVVSGSLACAAVRYSYDPGFDADSPQAQADIAVTHDVLAEVGVQASYSDAASKRYLHHSDEAHFVRPRFIQIPPALLHQN